MAIHINPIAGTHEVVESNNLVLDAEPDVVCVEKIRVLLLQLLPYKTGEPWLNVGLDLQRGDDLGLQKQTHQCICASWMYRMRRAPGSYTAVGNAQSSFVRL
jgi:hypothetical protein